VKFSW